MHMTNREIIQQYVPLVHFLGQALGRHYEIVLHDFSDPEKSVVAIENGYLSGRREGSPVTNLVLKKLQQEQEAAGHPESALNYVSSGPGGKTFHSSSYFIRDDKGRSIGALCVNMDTKPIREAILALQVLTGNLSGNESLASAVLPQEVLTGSAEETMDSLFETVRLRHAHHKLPTAADKQNFIRDLVLEGAFMFKGSVPYLAKKLNMSEPTLYRYLSKVNQK